MVKMTQNKKQKKILKAPVSIKNKKRLETINFKAFYVCYKTKKASLNGSLCGR